ncbi:MAG: CinA family protein [Aliivibrio sp.]|uniref:CinA family protein n=1 Tax=Aliivibrio sp. TaxID=1872443 RepID=UPI001A422334|nr:CinA family protein [Aliivibrio sp.]
MKKNIELATQLADNLLEKGWMMSCAESCTGGGVAYVATEIAGSSQWFERGFVTYTNEAKHQMLAVDVETIERYGAVSQSVVREMAAGALTFSNAQISVAISGIAGPGGATEGKPVGTVCFGWQTVEGEQRQETCQFIGNRQEVREQAIEHAYKGLILMTS